MARNLSSNKSTDLKNESFLSSSMNSESFESPFLNSPSYFSSSTLNDSFDFQVDEGIGNPSFTTCVDKQSNIFSDYEIDSSSVSPSVTEESIFETSHILNEPWKSAKVNFLNDWSQSQEAFGIILMILLTIHLTFSLLLI